MKKIIFLSAFLLFAFALTKCDKKEEKETILKGNTSILVDESLKPIIEEQIQIFQSRYEGKINLFSDSENEIIDRLANDSIRIAVLSRKLTEKERNYFKTKKKINPRETPFATDAIVLIANKNTKDTIISVQEIIDFLSEKTTTKIKGLVFDNPNSSSMRYFNDLVPIKKENKNIYSFKTNKEVIEYVSKNNGMVGVVGMNWIENTNKDFDNISILSVKGLDSSNYIYPSQNNLAEKKYPLARDLYIINCQGFPGLGMGFSSFVAGEVGQRIILKSGLLPNKMPGRYIITRKNIEKKENN